MPDLDTLERFVRTTAVYGLAFVALAAFVGICIYGFFWVTRHGIGILGSFREWVPQWFSSQVAMHKSVQNSVDVGTETMKEMRVTLAETHTGVKELLAIAHRERDE